MRTFLADLRSRLSPLEQPYFAALRARAFTRDDFVETQAQFLFAVITFPRPMALLTARLPSPEERLPLLRNIWDEHGGSVLTQGHEATFLTLLERLGLKRTELERRALWPEVRAFNDALWGVCAHDDTATALAVLGIIEDLFSTFAGEIGESIVAHGWLKAEDLVHYPVHREVDVEHAEAFLRLIEPVWAGSLRGAYQVQQGLELGAYLFLRLYEDLYRARGRRSLRSVDGPHGNVDGWRLPPR